MTWTMPPANIITGFFDGAPIRTQTIEPWEEAIHCPSGALSFTCPMNIGRGDVLFFPIAESLAVFGDVYDWYVLSILCDFPAVEQGSLSCIPQPSVYAPCARDDVAHSVGHLGYWQPDRGTYVPVPGLTFGLVHFSTGEAMPDSAFADGLDKIPGVPSDRGVAPRWDLGVFDEFAAPVGQSLVLNPDPLFPVPDDDGNMAGQALWTRSQLAAMDGVLGLEWASEGIMGTSNIGVSASIAPLTEVPEIYRGPGVINVGPGKSGVVRRKRTVGSVVPATLA